MKKDKILFDSIMNTEFKERAKNLLFTRKFEKEVYKFYLVVDKICISNELIYYYIVETPENCFGYNDIIDFFGGCGFSTHRYQPKWIKNSCKNALLKRGFRGGRLENNHRDFQVYFKE
ncbi:MAG: hypothetical protein J6Y29_00030 [Clostridiales bacterium]|nr:hypothetical protein [Clostridiales bacterium]